MISFSVMAQDLFESAAKSNENALSYQLNGDLRGILYVNKKDDKASLQSSYGEAAIKLSVSKQNFGKAYAEMRLKSGFEFGETLNEILLREAWVSTNFSKFNFTLGKQIIAWGRADGINPTDQVTPKNFIVRSPEPDDIRLGNFLFNAQYNLFNYLKITGIWVPRYVPSYMPIQIAEIPSNVKFNGIRYNDFNISNSELLFKCDIQLNKFDGSLSYKGGYGQYPGLIIDSIKMTLAGPEVQFSAKPFRQHIIGADFSTSLSSFGIRGEIAYQITKDYDSLKYIPNPDLQYVFGIDRKFGNFMIIAQYIGHYVFDFKNIPTYTTPLDALYNQMENYNRLMTMQTHKMRHEISLRPSISLFHENVEIEAFGMYDFTTKEYLIMPKVTYNVTDAFKIALGAQYYDGPDNTIYDLIGPALNSAYLQCKVSF